MKKAVKKSGIIILGTLISFGLSFTSCTKTEMGPKGDTGAAGATGATGATGAEGNANVYSYKFNVPVASFTGPLSNGAYRYVFNPTTVMGGSTFISEEDVILMYLFDHNTAGTDYYDALPFLNYFNTGTAFNQYSFQVGATGTPNIILLDIRNSGGGQPFTSMTTGTLSYKMVYIKSTNHIKPQLPENLSYASVKEYYHLLD